MRQENDYDKIPIDWKDSVKQFCETREGALTSTSILLSRSSVETVTETPLDKELFIFSRPIVTFHSIKFFSIRSSSFLCAAILLSYALVVTPPAVSASVIFSPPENNPKCFLIVCKISEESFKNHYLFRP